MASYPLYKPMPVHKIQSECLRDKFFLHDCLLEFKYAYENNLIPKAIRTLVDFYFEWKQYFAVCNYFSTVQVLRDSKKDLSPEQSKYIFAFLYKESKLLEKMNIAATIIQRAYRKRFLQLSG